MLVADRLNALGLFIGGRRGGSGSDKNSSFARSGVRALGDVTAGWIPGAVPWH
jgi:hypothetical protein